MDLSIVIPAYNVESHIENCLKSLLNQNIDSSRYEIIVVNDGSTDATESIVRGLIADHGNIKLINQENKGIGGARNRGVDIACGHYLYFVDADDYIAANTLEKILNLAIKNDLDIIGFNSKQVTSHSLSKSDNIDEDKPVSVMKGTQFIGKHNFKPEVWWYFIRRQFYHNCKVTFYHRKFLQDSYITPILFSKAERVVYLNYDVYRYYMSNNSITRNKSKKHLKTHFKDLAFAIEKQDELIKSIENENKGENIDCLKMLKAKKERYVLISIVRYFKSDFSFKELSKDLEIYREKDAYPFRFFPKVNGFDSLLNRTLVFIFNSKPLLNVSFRSYQLLKRLT
ncbi:glycosyltransferase [Flagellimonas oceanensis]|uniref:glycosyltransferase n=1 Tax=Flagellimonas oceanensis TaxID=2499163 RepID=UPI003BAA1BA0